MNSGKATKNGKTPKVFYCYFWKSQYRANKKHQWIVQYRGKRNIVNSFKILVPTESKSRNRNPHAVLYGRANQVTIKNKTAIIQ